MAKKNPVAKAVPAPVLVGYLIKVDSENEPIEDNKGTDVDVYPPDLNNIVTEAEANNWDSVVIYEVREIGRLPRPKREVEIYL
jgi:hypothetical protein